MDVFLKNIGFICCYEVEYIVIIFVEQKKEKVVVG